MDSDGANLPVQRYMATRDQYGHHNYHVFNGFLDSEHAESRHPGQPIATLFF